MESPAETDMRLPLGYNACSTYDTLGKLAGEYLRAKTVDLPKKFLDRGRV